MTKNATFGFILRFFADEIPHFQAHFDFKRKKAEAEKEKQLKTYYAYDNVIKYFTNREASRTQEY